MISNLNTLNNCKLQEIPGRKNSIKNKCKSVAIKPRRYAIDKTGMNKIILPINRLIRKESPYHQ